MDKIMDIMVKRKIPGPSRNDTLITTPVASCYTGAQQNVKLAFQCSNVLVSKCSFVLDS
jgi:hypothetical protein